MPLGVAQGKNSRMRGQRLSLHLLGFWKEVWKIWFENSGALGRLGVMDHGG